MLSKISSNISNIVNGWALGGYDAKKKISSRKIIAGICLLFFCSQVSIPLKPVPITMQTAGVLILSLIYRRSDALIAMCSYLILGGMGLPVFSNFSGGIEKLIGPTAGYFAGMLLCIYLVTTLRKKYGDDSLAKLALYGLVGSVSVYMIGIPYLAYLIGFDKAIKLGLLPFIIPGIAKALFVASSLSVIRRNIDYKK